MMSAKSHFSIYRELLTSLLRVQQLGSLRKRELVYYVNSIEIFIAFLYYKKSCPDGYVFDPAAKRCVEIGLASCSRKFSLQNHFI